MDVIPSWLLHMPRVLRCHGCQSEGPGSMDAAMYYTQMGDNAQLNYFGAVLS